MFICAIRKWNKLQFANVEIETKNTLKVNQRRYFSTLKNGAQKSSYSYFWWIYARFLWITYLRPDITISIALFTQVTEEWFESDKIGLPTKENNNFKNSVGNMDRTSQVTGFDESTPEIQVYSDASWAANKSKCSQLGNTFFCLIKAKRFNQFTGYHSNPDLSPVQF